MPPAIHLGVVHRSRLFRECLATALCADPLFRVTQFEHSSDDAPVDVDVWIVDLGLPGDRAIRMIQQFRDRGGSSKVIALISTVADEALVQCVAAGAQGCVVEDATFAELQEAIGNVIDGSAYCSHGIMHCMFRQMRELAEQSQWRERASHAELTDRELEILNLISNHRSNKQIASQLCVSVYTVKNHVHHILEKLQVRNRFQAVDYARGKRWIANAE